MIVLKKLTLLNKIYPEASLGTQRRNPTITTTTKKVVTIGGDNPTTTTTEVVTKTEPTPLGTSPDVYSWDPIRVLNPEWLATHSPFSIESIVDALLVGLILFIIALIVIVYVMWGAYYSNTTTSFIIGKKKLPMYHLALISIAVLVGVLTLSLIYVAVFAGIMVEAASLKGLCSDITKLQSEIEEIRTLVEFPSIEKKK